MKKVFVANLLKTKRTNFSGIYLSSITLMLILVSCNNQEDQSLMPDTKVFDITDPVSWGGNPEIAATPANDSDDDALAINAAMNAAMDQLKAKRGKGESPTSQQVIYLPGGIYHLASPVIVPKNEIWEEYIWLMGDGQEQTILRLKGADEIGAFGTATAPRPVMQFALYTLGKEGQGNTNVQLWATDLTIVVPGDQPHSIGMSFGAANMGGIRNVTIKAEGTSGHTGFALVQYNNGPGWIENLTVEGFNTGIDISDGWGELFGFNKISVINQNPGGTGVRITDKQIAIEDLVSLQQFPDVTPIYLLDDDAFNSEFGGAPHLVLLNAELKCNANASVPAILIDKGHSYLRDVRTSGYGNEIIKDHGKVRTIQGGTIDGEYISVHGNTKEEKNNVAVAINAPEQSLLLDILPTPEIDASVFNAFANGNYTIVDQSDLGEDGLDVRTPWVIVDPTKSNDDTELFQAAINSGARYLGITNQEPVVVSQTIIVNGGTNKDLELIYGYMSEINATSDLSQRVDPEKPNDKNMFRIESGNAERLFIKGLRVTADGRSSSDLLLFQNNSSQTLVFEDFRCKSTSRHYRNGGESEGSHVFFENVEFAYNGMIHEDLMVFDHQQIWARQFNVESPIRQDSIDYAGKRYPKYTICNKVRNRNSNLWVLHQKLGEHNGIFVQTEKGGKTELLAAYFNAARTNDFPVDPAATNFLVMDPGSEFSLVGQERIRTYYDQKGNATQKLPHGNQFGVISGTDGKQIIEGTSLPTYLEYQGYDPFTDTSYEIYDHKNHIRIAGLIRLTVR